MTFVLTLNGIFKAGVCISFVLTTVFHLSYTALHRENSLTVPLVSRILPSDVCRLRKMGSNIRLDTTLVDFDDKRWVRGDLSIFFFGEQPTSHSLAIVDNNMGVYQWIQYSGVSSQIYCLLCDFELKQFSK